MSDLSKQDIERIAQRVAELVVKKLQPTIGGIFSAGVGDPAGVEELLEQGDRLAEEQKRRESKEE